MRKILRGSFNDEWRMMNVESAVCERFFVKFLICVIQLKLFDFR